MFEVVVTLNKIAIMSDDKISVLLQFEIVITCPSCNDSALRDSGFPTVSTVVNVFGHLSVRVSSHPTVGVQFELK